MKGRRFSKASSFRRARLTGGALVAALVLFGLVAGECFGKTKKSKSRDEPRGEEARESREDSRRKSKSDRRDSKKSKGADWMGDQQALAGAMADKKADGSEPEDPQALRNHLADVERRLEEAGRRHESEMAALRGKDAAAGGDAKAAKKVKKAIEREVASYKRLKAVLDTERQDLLARLGSARAQ